MASPRKFFIDWYDSDYPQIRQAEDAPDPYEELKSLTACKREIITHFQNEISHARLVMRDIRSIRLDDFRGEKP